MLTIREAARTDADRIRAVHADAVRDLRGRYYTDEELAAWAAEDPTVHLDELCVVLEFDGEVVGFAALAPAVSELTAVYVDPSSNRTGVGRQLVADLESRARDRGLRELHLVTPLTASFFCLRTGFRPVETAVYETEGEPLDAYLMEKPL